MGFIEEFRKLFPERSRLAYSIDSAALAGGNIVGAVFAKMGEDEAGRLVFSASPEYGQIQTINVRDDYQRRGIGRGLFAYYERWLADRGIRTVKAMYVDSPQAESFWKSMGFSRTEPSSKDWTKAVRP